jgi:hypothetical protein
LGEKKITRKFSGLTVAGILKQKKGSIKQAKLLGGSPDWDEFSQMTWEEIEAGAKANKPGFKVVRKLLTDKRFDK